MCLCRELTSLSYPEIGKYFGGKDHTTVMYACRQIEMLREKDIKIRNTIEALIKSLKLK